MGSSNRSWQSSLPAVMVTNLSEYATLGRTSGGGGGGSRYFETSLVMASYYGYEIWRHKWQVVKPFLSEEACFFHFYQQ